MRYIILLRKRKAGREKGTKNHTEDAQRVKRQVDRQTERKKDRKKDRKKNRATSCDHQRDRQQACRLRNQECCFHRYKLSVKAVGCTAAESKLDVLDMGTSRSTTFLIFGTCVCESNHTCDTLKIIVEKNKDSKISC